jgi:arylsulfatase A-like enzyme
MWFHRNKLVATLRAWPVLAMLLCAACSRAPEPPKNVVLISLDTLRADRMSLYGAERRTTPVIDELARRGVRFTNAFSPSPWTLPAHAAMLTGRYPSSLSSNFDDHLYRLAPLLSAILKEHGYQTAAVAGGGFVSKAYGADVGFDSFQVGKAADAVSWIQSAPKEPFFFFFHTYTPHVPYSDRRYTDGIDGGTLATIYSGKAKEWIAHHTLVSCGWVSPTTSEKEFLLALYDGGVTAADEIVGDLLAALQSAGVVERTIVVITSDHGEEFWDHTDRGAYHGHTLYDELLRVPLVWYEPGLRRRGSTQAELVNLVDIVPTMLARLRVPAPAGLDGVDLSPLLDKGKWNVERTLFAEAVRHGPPRQSAINASGKLIVTLQPEVQLEEGQRCPVPVREPRELYLPSDPGETQNRVHEDGQRAAALDAELQLHNRSASAQTPSLERAPIDEETRERLRALGYLE